MTQNVPATTDKDHNGKNVAKIACVAFAVLSVVVYYIPYGYYLIFPFSSLYTFVHEAGHGIAAILVGGRFVKFEMWTNGSGVATTATPKDMSGFGHAFISFGGLIAPAIWAIIFLFLAKNKKVAAWGMVAVGALCILSVVMLVRTLFGILFIGAFGVIIGAIGLHYIMKSKSSGEMSSVPQYCLLLMSMMLCTLVYTRGDYLFTRYADTTAGIRPSDVQSIANHLLLPYWFWGGLIALLSATILIGGLYFFFREPKKAPEKGASHDELDERAE